MPVVNTTQTLDELFSIWESMTAMADAIGETHWNVRKWKTRKSIPPEHWARVINAAREKGVDLSTDDLMLMHALPLPDSSSDNPHALGGDPCSL